MSWNLAYVCICLCFPLCFRFQFSSSNWCKISNRKNFQKSYHFLKKFSLCPLIVNINMTYNFIKIFRKFQNKFRFYFKLTYNNWQSTKPALSLKGSSLAATNANKLKLGLANHNSNVVSSLEDFHLFKLECV